eukprot:4634845-Amphidinium_carterae.1
MLLPSALRADMSLVLQAVQQASGATSMLTCHSKSTLRLQQAEVIRLIHRVSASHAALWQAWLCY